jgi:hypothetical protein
MESPTQRTSGYNYGGPEGCAKHELGKHFSASNRESSRHRSCRTTTQICHGWDTTDYEPFIAEICGQVQCVEATHPLFRRLAAATKREFGEHDRYDRSGPVRWIVSHLIRYLIFPLIAAGCRRQQLSRHDPGRSDAPST